MNAPVNVPTTVQLVDHSPPNGDYARYIEQLMQRSEAAAAAQVAQAGGARPVSSVPAAHTLPGRREGPPDLKELLGQLIKSKVPQGKRSGLAKAGQPKGVAAVPAWWLWAVVAVIVAGVIFPYGLGWIVVVVFILWRMAKSASSKGGRKS